MMMTDSRDTPTNIVPAKKNLKAKIILPFYTQGYNPNEPMPILSLYYLLSLSCSLIINIPLYPPTQGDKYRKDELEI
jgi:hypothetical protein